MARRSPLVGIRVGRRLVVIRDGKFVSACARSLETARFSGLKTGLLAQALSAWRFFQAKIVATVSLGG